MSTRAHITQIMLTKKHPLATCSDRPNSTPATIRVAIGPNSTASNTKTRPANVNARLRMQSS